MRALPRKGPFSFTALGAICRRAAAVRSGSHFNRSPDTLPFQRVANHANYMAVTCITWVCARPPTPGDVPLLRPILFATNLLPTGRRHRWGGLVLAGLRLAVGYLAGFNGSSKTWSAAAISVAIRSTSRSLRSLRKLDCAGTCCSGGNTPPRILPLRRYLCSPFHRRSIASPVLASCQGHTCQRIQRIICKRSAQETRIGSRRNHRGIVRRKGAAGKMDSPPLRSFRES